MCAFRNWWAATAITIILGIGRPAQAQDLLGERVNLHPVKDQVGVVTRAEGPSIWIRMPQPLAAGQTVAFLLYSDGGDTLATGKIAWAAPISPYEAYVTAVHAISTRHPVNPYDSLDAFEVPTKRTRRYGARPQADGNGVSLAAGFFARTTVASSQNHMEAVEPVRAYIAALRALKAPNQLAQTIADAAARALPTRAVTTARPDEYAVDYKALYDTMDRYQRLHIEDSVVAYVVRRLHEVAAQNDGIATTVPGDFLRSPGEAAGTQVGRRP